MSDGGSISWVWRIGETRLTGRKVGEARVANDHVLDVYKSNMSACSGYDGL